MQTLIFGDGPLGTSISAAFRARGDHPRLVGRPAAGGHAAASLGRPDLIVEASRGDAVAANIAVALAAGARRFVIATTDWEADRVAVDRDLRHHGGAAIAAPNLSLGAALFFRVVERAASLFQAVDFDPYIVEWHRRSKRDRPSGTARELARRVAAAGGDSGAGDPSTAEPEIAVIRAGASPGMHLVGFDAAGETVELRLTARDRSAYAAGAIAAADWLDRLPRSPGLHAFDEVVDELVGAPPSLAFIA